MDEIQLSEHQQRTVWEEWLSAEIRAHYFGDLTGHYQRTQRGLTWLTLLASSGAAVTFLAALPAGWVWVRPALALAAAGMSLWALVSNYPAHASGCADLHLKWQQLAVDYERLWANMYTATAQDDLRALLNRSTELGRTSVMFPNREAAMRKSQRYIVAHRHAAQTPTATAA